MLTFSPTSRVRSRGVITGARVVDTVVIPTENATSPLQRKLMMLEETPPGQDPTSTSPRVSPSESPNILAIEKAASGMMVNWATAPIKISSGLFARIL